MDCPMNNCSHRQHWFIDHAEKALYLEPGTVTGDSTAKGLLLSRMAANV